MSNPVIIKNKTIIKEIIEECIEVDGVFSYIDLLEEAYERGSSFSESAIKSMILTHRYPLYYHHTQIVKSDDIIDVIHPKDKNPNDYITELDSINKSKSEFGTILGLGLTPTTIPNTEEQIEVEVKNDLPSLSDRKDYAILDQIFGNNEKLVAKTRVFDNRGRYLISASDVKLAGLNAGDNVLIILQDGYVSVVLDEPNADINGGKIVTRMKVDKYHNIRLNGSIFHVALDSARNKFNQITSVSNQPIRNSRLINLYPTAE